MEKLYTLKYKKGCGPQWIAYIWDKILSIFTSNKISAEKEIFKDEVYQYLSQYIGKNAFGLDWTLSSIKLWNGNVSVVYKLSTDTGNEYIWKTRHNHKELLQNELLYYKIQEENNVPWLVCLGSWIATIGKDLNDEYRLCTKFEKSIGWVEEYFLLQRCHISEKLGASIAQIHQITSDKYCYTEEGLIIDWIPKAYQQDIIFKKAMQRVADQNLYPDYVQTQQYCEKYLIESIDHDWRVLIHGDLGMNNVLLQADDKVILFDPNARIDHPYMDIASFFSNMWNATQERTRFLESYVQISWSEVDSHLLDICLFFALSKKLRTKILRKKSQQSIDSTQQELWDVIKRLQKGRSN